VYERFRLYIEIYQRFSNFSFIKSGGVFGIEEFTPVLNESVVRPFSHHFIKTQQNLG
jgi:hypothetical protein